MKLEEILELWNKDSVVDKTELGDEAISIPKLHHKYYRIFVMERLALRKQEFELKQLKLDKYEFLTQGPNEETKDKGWRLPAKGMILKNDLPLYTLTQVLSSIKTPPPYVPLYHPVPPVLRNQSPALNEFAYT